MTYEQIGKIIKNTKEDTNENLNKRKYNYLKKFNILYSTCVDDDSIGMWTYEQLKEYNYNKLLNKVERICKERKLNNDVCDEIMSIMNDVYCTALRDVIKQDCVKLEF